MLYHEVCERSGDWQWHPADEGHHGRTVVAKHAQFQDLPGKVLGNDLHARNWS